MKVAVIGLGYVGLVQAVGCARLGHTVLGIDIDAQKIELLQAGRLPFFELGLEEMIREVSGRFFCTNDMAAIGDFAPELILICVPTPSKEDGGCNTEYVEKAVASVAASVKQKTIVVLKSTAPPGIRGKLVKIEDEGMIEIASVPEFLREGHALRDFFYPDRIVLGVQSARAEELLRALHAKIQAPIFVMSVESAQLTKYASNAMLATRLSFINEVANIADVVGADISQVAEAVGADKRIGAAFLRAGAGFGGSCFPKDVLALAHTAQEMGYETRIIRPIIDINNDQPSYFVEKIKAHLGSLAGLKVGVWGLAFAANTDDVRESPAIRVIELLLKEGVEIRAFDPKGINQARKMLSDRIAYTESKEEILNGEIDTLLVLTEWPEFIEADWNYVAPRLNVKIIFDGKNCVERSRVKDAGLAYCGIGICSDDLRHRGN